MAEIEARAARKAGRPKLAAARPQFRVRLPASIADDILAVAASEGRSVSEEIERRVVREHDITRLLQLLMNPPPAANVGPVPTAAPAEPDSFEENADAAQAPLDGLVIDVPVAASLLGIGRNAAYEAVRRGEIPSVRLGGRIRVPTAAIRKMLGIERAVENDLTGGTRD